MAATDDVRNAPEIKRTAEFCTVSNFRWLDVARYVKTNELYSSIDRIKLVYIRKRVCRSPPHDV